MHKRLPLTFAVLATLGLSALTGCDPYDRVPTGSPGGRVDPYRTTPADRASSKANIPSMLEMTEQVARRLAQDIADIDAIRNTPEKEVLELGSLRNQTGTPTGDFELMQNRLRGQLLRSDVIRREFDFVVERERMQDEMRRVQPSDQTEGTTRYAAGDTYVLQGSFFEATRGRRRQYYFEFTLTNLKTRRIVFQDDYDLGQM